MTKPKRGTKSITLVELLFVLAMIAVLAAVIVPSMRGTVRRSGEQRYETDRENLQRAVERYYNQTHSVTGTDGTSTASGHVYPTYIVDVTGSSFDDTGDNDQPSAPSPTDITIAARWEAVDAGSWIDVGLLIQAGFLSNVPDSCSWANTIQYGTLSGTWVTLAATPMDYYRGTPGSGTYAWYVDSNGRVQSRPTFASAGLVYP